MDSTNLLVKTILSQFDNHNIPYCHWKSNNNLKQALAGEDDIDLLVSKKHFSELTSIVSYYGFRQAYDTKGVNNPFVFHYYNYDKDSNKIIHFHIYFRIVTGGSIFKNYMFPVEDIILDNLRKLEGIWVPVPEIDRILLVLRKMLEIPSVIEHYLLKKDLANIKKELQWLSMDCSNNKLEYYLSIIAPFMTLKKFNRCEMLLLDSPTSIEAIRLGRFVRRNTIINVASKAKVWVARTKEFFGAYVSARLSNISPQRMLFPGGCMVSFVGSEASGKSTLSLDLEQLLSSTLRVKKYHLGKPPKTWKTKPLWWLIKLYSRLNAVRIGLFLSSNAVESKRIPSSREMLNEPHPIVAFLDSIDRRSAVIECFRLVLNNTIVITDRYPSSKLGNIDGPRIMKTDGLYGLLGRLEKLNYSSLPRPDLVFQAYAPLELTIERNGKRARPEPESFVRQRFSQMQNQSKEDSNIVRIETKKDFVDCSKQVRETFFEFYSGNLEQRS